MARIPMAEGLGTQTARLNQGVSIAGGQTAALDSVARLAQVGAEFVIENDRRERAIKVHTATTQAAKEMKAYATTLMEQDRDYRTFQKRYADYAADVQKRYQKELGDDQNAFNAWNEKFNLYVEEVGYDVHAKALDGQRDVQKGQLDSNLNGMEELHSNASPQERALIETEAGIQLQEAYDNHVISAEELVNRRIKFESSIRTGEVRKDILTDPDATILKLRNSEYKGLSSEEQVLLLEKATAESEARTRRQLTEAGRLEREQEKFEKKAQDEMSKAGDKLLASGELTEQWVEDNRDTLSPADHRYFYDKLSGAGEGRTDPIVYSDLRTRASNGEDVRGEARDMLRKGRIKSSDYEKLVNRSEQNAGISNVPDVFSRGEKHIAQALHVSDFNQDPAAKQRLASALDDWAEWMTKNQGAPASEARDAYKSIVKEYSLIDYTAFTLTMRKPKHAVGDHNNMDIQATIDRTVEAYQAGKLTEEEFANQSLLIKEWENAMTKKEGAQ